MKKIGIYDILYCSDLDYKARIDIYKKAGFREFALYLDNGYMERGENYLDIVEYAKKLKFDINQVHLDYKNSNGICDEEDNYFFDYLEGKAKECKNLSIKNMVIHASRGDVPPKISDVCLNKLETLVKKYPEINFCFENVRNNENLDCVLNINQPNIKVCFDLGHAHAYGDEREMFNKYKDKIACSHLHNNFGSDEHRALTDGEIDFLPIVKRLAEIENCSNCIEAFPQKNSHLSKKQFFNFVKMCYDSIENV